MLARGAICLLLLVALTLTGGRCSTRYFVKMRTNASDLFRTRSDSSRMLEDSDASPSRYQSRLIPSSYQSEADERRTKDTKLQNEQKNQFESSTFNPDVLNKFLEEYANKIKGSTEKYPRYPFRIVKPAEPLLLEVDDPTTHATSVSHNHETKFEVNVENTTAAEDSVGLRITRGSFSKHLLFGNECWYIDHLGS